MSDPSLTDAPVLIVGAGPTGLVLELWLARLGTRPRIIDRAAEPGTTSRALAMQARVWSWSLAVSRRQLLALSSPLSAHCAWSNSPV
jgi:glycine/D-amino acid oxidase-like deaminating enzyme